MKALFQNSKLALSFFALAGALGCAPAASSSALTAPQATGVVVGPSRSGTPYTTDVSQTPAIAVFMGTYTGTLVRQSFGGVSSTRSFTFTMTRRQNTSGQGVTAYATMDLKILANGAEPEINQALYVGVDPVPYGQTYNLMTNSFSVPSLSSNPIAIRMLLSMKQIGANTQDVNSFAFDPSNSELDIIDCGISNTGAACLNNSTQVQFGNGIRKQ